MTQNSNRSIMLLAAAGTSLGLLLTGCGDNPVSLSVSESPVAPTTIASPSPPSDTVSPATPIDTAMHWMDGFCGAVHGFLRDSNDNAMAQPTTTISPKAAKQVFLKDLSDYTAILNKAIDRMTALPPISDPVGKVAYETYLGKYTSARDRLVAAKARLEKAARTDYAAQNGAIKALETAQEEGLSVVDPVGAIEGSPTLGTASAFAPECKKVA
jgi:hypothetical protein